MRTWTTCSVWVLLAACPRVAPPPPRVDTPAPVEDCTLTTPLVPGAPGSPGNLLPSDLNPNGVSELAALMRAMQHDLEAARAAIGSNQPVAPLYPRARRIRCAWPSAMSDHTEKFDRAAQMFLELTRAMDERRYDPRVAYESVLVGCRTCHDNSCQGPIVVIESLHLPATAWTDAGTPSAN